MDLSLFFHYSKSLLKEPSLKWKNLFPRETISILLEYTLFKKIGKATLTVTSPKRTFSLKFAHLIPAIE